MLISILDLCHTDFSFDTFNDVNSYFKKMINIFKQMNYSEFKSEKFNKFEEELKELIKTKQVAVV